ncbi:uncharacterized protein LOC134848579 [Symsagittifera roscoffensis]|uniref:uncharacterized protein LOC134848579 n=1 Tax=Symsagittifera roscoffensis TaxID=84072 RepID=UPI00307BDA1B
MEENANDECQFGNHWILELEGAYTWMQAYFYYYIAPEDYLSRQDIVMKPNEIILPFAVKFAGEVAQIPVLLTVLLLNLYCLMVILRSEELHTLDYFLITYQCLSDLLYSGFLGTVFFFFDNYLHVKIICKFFMTMGLENCYPFLVKFCQSLSGYQLIGPGETVYLVFDDLGWQKNRSQLYYSLFKYIPDYYSYWSQVFLMLAISIERYILIVKATESKTLLSTRRRRLLYGFAIILGFIIPSVYVVDYVFVNMLQIELGSDKDFQYQYNYESLWCKFCSLPTYVHTIVLPAVFHLSSILCSGFLYWRTWHCLRGMKQLDRKELLSKTFAILWISWVLLVTPDILKEAITGSTSDERLNIGAAYTGSFQQFMDEFFIKKEQFEALDYEWNSISLTHATMILAIKASLRTVKISFGFVNSIILIVLMKPFHEPIIRLIQRLSNIAKTVRSKVASTNSN